MRLRLEELAVDVEETAEGLTGTWDIVLLPIDQRGTCQLQQSGAVLNGTYQLDGGWTGSLQGTLVNRKVFLVRIDSRLGKSMELEGFLSSDGRQIRGTWLSYELAGNEGSTGQWSAERRAGFVGVCVLQRDMTWTIEPSEWLGDRGPLTNALGRFFDGFAEMLDTYLTLEEILPYHVGGLPYFPRLYANALSRSLRTAVSLGDQAATQCRQWSKELPRRESELLARALPAGASCGRFSARTPAFAARQVAPSSSLQNAPPAETAA